MGHILEGEGSVYSRWEWYSLCQSPWLRVGLLGMKIMV